MERDPLVLSGLMWSWLEQLKDPVISSEDVKALSEKNVNPQSALNSLEKVIVLNISSTSLTESNTDDTHSTQCLTALFQSTV